MERRRSRGERVLSGNTAEGTEETADDAVNHATIVEAPCVSRRPRVRALRKGPNGGVVKWRVAHAGRADEVIDGVDASPAHRALPATPR